MNFKKLKRTIAALLSAAVMAMNVTVMPMSITALDLDGAEDHEILSEAAEFAAPPAFSLDRTVLKMEVGDTDRLIFTEDPAYVNETTTRTWRSDNESVVTVNQNGNIRAVGEGTAVVTVSLITYYFRDDGSPAPSFSYTAMCEITVSPAYIAYLDRDKLTLMEGETDKLTLTINPRFVNENTTITWSSDNEDVVTVDDNGNVTAVGEGTAVVAARFVTWETMVDGSAGPTMTFTAMCEITVGPEYIVYIDRDELTLMEGETDKLTLTINPKYLNGSFVVVWSSDNEEVVTVDDNGNITAVGAGTAAVFVTFIATMDNGRNLYCITKCNITVNPVTPAMTIDRTELTLEVGDTDKLTVTLNPKYVNETTEIMWVSKDENVVTVDQKGNIKAVGEGTAVVAVSYHTYIDGDDGYSAKVITGTMECYVTVTPVMPVISIDKTELTLRVGDTDKLTVTINPKYVNESTEIMWGSYDENVVTVDQEGNIKAVGEGTADVGMTFKTVETFDDSATKVMTATIKCNVTVVNSSIIYGDADGNGTIDSEDVVVILRYAAQYSVDIDKVAADVNLDGAVNSNDAVLILQKLANYDVELGKKSE